MPKRRRINTCKICNSFLHKTKDHKAQAHFKTSNGYVSFVPEKWLKEIEALQEENNKIKSDFEKYKKGAREIYEISKEENKKLKETIGALEAKTSFLDKNAETITINGTIFYSEKKMPFVLAEFLNKAMFEMGFEFSWDISPTCLEKAREFLKNKKELK